MDQTGGGGGEKRDKSIPPCLGLHGACKPSTWEVGGPGVAGHLWQHSRCEARLD